MGYPINCRCGCSHSAVSNDKSYNTICNCVGKICEDFGFWWSLEIQWWLNDSKKCNSKKCIKSASINSVSENCNATG